MSPQGKDVQIELPLAPWEAALGAKVAVPTLGGTVEVTVPAGAQSGQKLRLRGRGFPGTPGGDQIVSIKLVTPAAQSAQAKEAYERMKKEFNFDPRAGLAVTQPSPAFSRRRPRPNSLTRPRRHRRPRRDRASCRRCRPSQLCAATCTLCGLTNNADTSGCALRMRVSNSITARSMSGARR